MTQGEKGVNELRNLSWFAATLIVVYSMFCVADMVWSAEIPDAEMQVAYSYAPPVDQPNLVAQDFVLYMNGAELCRKGDGQGGVFSCPPTIVQTGYHNFNLTAIYQDSNESPFSATYLHYIRDDSNPPVDPGDATAPTLIEIKIFVDVNGVRTEINQ